jgi:radical SAM superfamily enzyme YgiQ (UPF0313 family)
MKIILANLDPGKSEMIDKKLEKRRSTLHFPIGLGIIAACLAKSGKQFHIYDSYVNGTTEKFLLFIDHMKPDVILLSGFLGNFGYGYLKDIAEKLKSIHPQAFIILGGAMATSIPKLLMEKTLIDIVVVGEGEITIIQLLTALEKKSDLSTVEGIWFRNPSKNIIFTGNRRRISNLDVYPFPLYEAFSIKKYLAYLKKTNRCWEISSSRGCYNGCKFCKRIFGREITAYSPEAVVNHMNYVSRKFGINRFNFVDDNFLSNAERLENFIRLLENNHNNYQWRFQGRVDQISPVQVEKMLKVGLLSINFGVESGSQNMLAEYGKNLDIKITRNTLSSISYMVEIYVSFIVGGPGENWATINETREFIKKARIRNVSAGILTLFPGSVLYEQAKKGGLIPDEEDYCLKLGPVYDRPYINMSNMTDEELLEARDMINQTGYAYAV